MRINSDQVRLQAQNAAQGVSKSENSDARTATGAVKSSKEDTAILSQTAQDMLVARKAFDEAPEIRSDKVAELKSQVDAGAFKVDAQIVVDKMMSGQ